MTMAFMSFAQEAKSSSSSCAVGLKFQNNNGTNPKPQRAPMHIDIQVYYNAEYNTIEISSDDDVDGEVFLYHNGNVVGYSEELNTTILIPATPGLYKILIHGESWIAEGYLHV